MRNLVTSATILAGLLVSTGVLAQEASAQGSGQANVGMSLPGATPATATAGTSDHDQMVGRLAVGYLGRSTIGAGSALGAADPADGVYAVTGEAPVVGVRYWLDRMIGLDLGVGIGILSGSGESQVAGGEAVEADLPSFTGFILHGGVPLALASAGHFTFQIVPEINVGFASAEIDPNGDGEGDLSMSGFHLDLGARAGSEIHFGFIGIPQLSLQGSVGLALALDSGKTTDSTPPDGTADTEISNSQTAFQTTFHNNPWDFFTANVAALYYF
jgi:hypothetical protein